MKIEVTEITRIKVEPGEVLYVELPEGMTQAQYRNAMTTFQKAFADKQVKVIVGSAPIKFSAVKAEEGYD